MKSTNLSEPLKRESASGRSEPPQSTLESSDSTFPTKVIIIAPSAISYDESPQLGTGGFGVVRKAQFEGQTVAIKKFIIDRESDDVVTKAALFLTEAKNMRELNHPRIVRFLGFIMEDIAIIMEFMNAGTLQEHLEKADALSWKERLTFMMDISEGMSYLHNSRHPNGKIKPVVYHQDLKSANVLLSMENGMLRGKISDFGLSAMRTKTQKQDGSISKSVFSGGVTHIGGTRVYMAPELSQSSTFTRECDVYSFGVIMMELLTLLPPNEAALDFRLKLDILSMEKMPKCLKEITENCMQLVPKNRPSFEAVFRYLTEKRHTIEQATLSKSSIKNSSKKLEETAEPRPEQDSKVHRGQSVAVGGFTNINNKSRFQDEDSFFFDQSEMANAIRKNAQKYNPLEVSSTRHAQRNPLFATKKRKLIIGIISGLIVCILAILLGILIPRLINSNNAIKNTAAIGSDNNGNVVSTATSSSLASSTPITSASSLSWSKLSSWGGANMPHLYALPSQSQIAILSTLKQSNIRTIRISITQTSASANVVVNDLEWKGMGQYDDSILTVIDSFLQNAYLAGIKVIISMHDRYSLGCTSNDVYVSAFGLSSTYPSCDPIQNVSLNNPSTFYVSATAINNFENRCKHILSFSSPNFGGKPWGSLSQVIYAFDLQNEPQAYIPASSVMPQWPCDRATALHSYLTNGVLLSSGGGSNFDNSIQYTQNATIISWPLFSCKYIDVVAVHSWSADEASTQTGLLAAASLASNKQKRVIFESVGTNNSNLNGTASFYRYSTGIANSFFIPWVISNVMESLATTVSSGYNVAINNTDSWTAILKAGSDAAFGVSSYTNISNAKLLPDWNYCLSNSMCQNQCCSNVYSSTDGRLKCTPGTNVCNAADVLASQTNSNGSTTATTTKTISSPSTAATSTMSSNAAVTPWLTDWSVCSANNQCLAGCCSNVYSSGSYKCTPNAGPNDCMGSVSSSSGGASSSSSTAAPTSGSSDLGAWQFCSTSSQCSNGCCSSQYSTSDGKLKCTPGGTICV